MKLILLIQSAELHEKIGIIGLDDSADRIACWSDPRRVVDGGVPRSMQADRGDSRTMTIKCTAPDQGNVDRALLPNHLSRRRFTCHSLKIRARREVSLGSNSFGSQTYRSTANLYSLIKCIATAIISENNYMAGRLL